MLLTNQDRRVIAGAVASTGAVSLTLWWLAGTLGVLVAVLLTLAILMVAQFDQFRLLERQADQNQRQTQALTWLSAQVETAWPLPPLTGWAATPELAAWVVALIRETKPRTVVELGSGSSTVLIAHLLQEQGGRLVSLDHDAAYAEQTRKNLAIRGLQAEVLDAPLRPLTLDGRERTWYDLSGLDLPETVDLLLVDGPPHTSHPQARYPAVPAFADRLSEGAVVVLDDAGRPDEKASVAAWCERYGMESHYVDTIKGAAVLRRARPAGR